MRARSSKDEAEHGQSEPDFSSTISAPNPMPHMTSTTRAIPLAQEFSSPPVQKPTPSNVFMAGGILASGQTSSVSSSAEGRRLMPLIVGGAALLLAGFGGGYFYMHQGSGPAPATSAILATQPPAQGLSAMPSDAAGQVAAEQVPTQPAVATVAREAEISATTDAQQNVRRAPGNADEKQPDRPAKQRQQIPGLKMKSPSAPKQNLAKIPDGIAPSITDVSSAIAVPGAPGAAMLAPVVRSENQPAPPLSLGIAGPSAKTIREPRLVSATRPVYPAVARQASTQGTVVVTAMVDAKGTITDVKAVSGPAALRQAAIDSVKQWKYSPALIDGKPASAQITVDVQFRLN
jgi:protein TonB